MTNKKILVTVFTPVYNRADIINKLYQSLRRQTVNDFEWLVIDDGSSDNIKEVINAFIEADNNFTIRFISKENGGKHTCINMATDIANGELFFIVDSDDYISDDAIEKITKMHATIEYKKEFCGIAGTKVHFDGSLVGTTFNEKYVDATSLERTKFNITGDKAEVFFTDILRRYKFPVFDNEKFLTEACVWLQMAANGYKIRWFNEPIYFCEYLEGGLSDLNKNKLLKNFKGDIYTIKLYMDLYHYSLPMRIRNYGFAYEMYKKSHNVDNLTYIIKTFEINKITLQFSYFIFKIYNFIKGKIINDR